MVGCNAARYKSGKEQNARDKWKRVGTKETKKGKSVKINERGKNWIKNETELKKKRKWWKETCSSNDFQKFFSSWCEEYRPWLSDSWLESSRVKRAWKLLKRRELKRALLHSALVFNALKSTEFACDQFAIKLTGRETSWRVVDYRWNSQGRKIVSWEDWQQFIRPSR